MVLYLVNSVSADGLGHPHAPRWPEGIGTLGATHIWKRCNYTDNMIAKQIEGLTQTLKYWYHIVVCKRDPQPVRLSMEAEMKWPPFWKQHL